MVSGMYRIGKTIDLGGCVGDMLWMYVRWHTSSTQVAVAALVSAPHYGWCVEPHTMTCVSSPTLRRVGLVGCRVFDTGRCCTVEVVHGVRIPIDEKHHP